VASEIEVRRAKFSDAQAIADFVNAAQSSAPPVTRLNVAERFGQVGFMIAEQDDGEMVGIMGWQVENLVVRVTDFLISPGVDRLAVGQAMSDTLEAEGRELQAEAVLLFLPPKPSRVLVEFWENFDYELQRIQDLHRTWREAALEWGIQNQALMVKQLREDLVQRPI
jgi:N-acetylglutamate synthase-like GNAT family acetyltransferase